MKDKKVKKLKVYGAGGKWYKEPPKILLQGQWLERLGFDCGDRISVETGQGRLIITKIDETNFRESAL